MKLILAAVLIGIPFSGWILRIYRGEKPAPEVDRWGSLLPDGSRLLVIGPIYAIPGIILTVIRFVLFPGPSGSPFGGTMADGGAEIRHVLALFPLILMLQLVDDIFLALVVPIAAIRFARTGSPGEAFSFGAILPTIGKIGWFSCIIAAIVITLVVAIPIGILALIVILAGVATGHIPAAIGILVLALFLLAPLFATVQARYMTQVYDTGEPAGTPAGSTTAA